MRPGFVSTLKHLSWFLNLVFGLFCMKQEFQWVDACATAFRHFRVLNVIALIGTTYTAAFIVVRCFNMCCTSSQMLFQTHRVRDRSHRRITSSQGRQKCHGLAIFNLHAKSASIVVSQYTKCRMSGLHHNADNFWDKGEVNPSCAWGSTRQCAGNLWGVLR